MASKSNKNKGGGGAPPQKSFRKDYKKVVDELKSAAGQLKAANRNQPQSKGKKGSKMTPAGKWLRRAGKVAGTFLGNGQLGEMLGAGVSRIFGQGDYRVQQNTMMAGPPSFAALNSGIRIRHREYLGDVLSTINFGNVTYPIQPTNSTTFPWLSQIAASFEQYKLHGLVFYFNSTAGNAIASTNNALGVVGMVTCYDPTQPAFGTKRQCEDYVGCTAAVPACSVMHAVECKPKSDVLDRYYCLVDAITDQEDLKFYNHGTVNLFTQGMQASGIDIGELWVSYDVEFFNPKIIAQGTISVADHYYIGGTASNANPLGAVSGSPKSGSNLGTTYSSSTFTIPAGTAAAAYAFFISTSVGSSITGPVYTQAGTTNLTALNMLQGDSVNQTNTPNGATANAWQGCVMTFLKGTTGAASLTLGSTVLGSGPTVASDVYIVALPSGLITSPGSILKEIAEKERFARYFKLINPSAILPSFSVNPRGNLEAHLTSIDDDECICSSCDFVSPSDKNIGRFKKIAPY